MCIDLYTSNLFLAHAINNNTHIDIYHQTEISVQHSNSSKLHNTKSSIHNVYIHVQFLYDGGTAHYQNIFVLKKNSVQYQQTLLVKYVHNNFIHIPSVYADQCFKKKEKKERSFTDIFYKIYP